jgi:hypothetical protein
VPAGEARALDGAVGLALGRLVARLGAGLTAKAALAAQEEAETIREEGIAGVGLHSVHLENAEAGLALVPQLGHPALASRVARGRNGLVENDLLLAVEQHGEVEGQTLDPAQAHHGAEGGDHREAGKHLQVLLIGVLELTRIRGGHAGTDAEVVKDDVVVVPAVLAIAERGAEGFGGIDGHCVLLGFNTWLQ